MKIAMIVGTFPKLSETFILNEIEVLINNPNIDLDIYATTKGDEKEIQPIIDKYDLLNKVVYLEWFELKSKVLKFKKVIKCLVWNIFNTGFKLRFSKDFLKDITLAYDMKLSVNNYDMIYCHFGNNGLNVYSLKKFNLVNSKLSVVFHGFDISTYIKRKGENVYKDMFKYVDFYLPISDFWGNKLVELGVDKSKIFIHRMGIDPNNFNFKNNKISGEMIFVSVCRLTEKKGLEFAIEALSKVDFPYKYYIVGTGPLVNELKELVSSLSLNNKVIFLGNKNQDEINSILDKSNILLAPSVIANNGDMEGIPVAIMEALAKGVLVVSTYHSGIPEIIDHGNNGFLSRERDVESLRDSITGAVNSDWSQITQNGRKIIENDFSTKNTIYRLLDLFNKEIIMHQRSLHTL